MPLKESLEKGLMLSSNAPLFSDIITPLFWQSLVGISPLCETVLLIRSARGHHHLKSLSSETKLQDLSVVLHVQLDVFTPMRQAPWLFWTAISQATLGSRLVLLPFGTQQ